MTDEEIICTVREAGMSDKELFHMAEQSGLMRFIVPEEYLMMYATGKPFESLRAFAEMVAARGESVNSAPIANEIARLAQEADDFADLVFGKGEFHSSKRALRDEHFALSVAMRERSGCVEVMKNRGN